MACGLNRANNDVPGCEAHDEHLCSECKNDNSTLCKDCITAKNCHWEQLPVMQEQKPEELKPLLDVPKMILSKVNLVSLNVCIWQGKKALKAEDLEANGIDTSQLPPATLASLGSKRIVSPEHVAQFNVLKREASKICSRYGVKFGNCGYAVPEDKIEEVNDALNLVKTKFETARDKFVSVYGNAVEDWVAENPPEWASTIRNNADSPERVAASLTFRFSILKIEEPAIPLTDNGVYEEVDSLYGQLCHEIRTMAKTAYETSFAGKTEVTRRAIRPIIAIREKLVGLGFLNVNIVDLVRDIDDVLSSMPQKGAIDGKELDMAAGLLANRLCNMGMLKADTINDFMESDIDSHDVVITREEVEREEVKAINWDF